MKGQIISELKINDSFQKINISHLPQGTYFIAISNQHHLISTKRFTKIN